MRLPGFVGDAALDASPRHRRPARAASFAAGGAVVPQALRGRARSRGPAWMWNPTDCIENCWCVVAEGCPCCNSLDTTLPRLPR